ncbi:MAG: iron transporter permease [Actinomycetia bacterium]|nr:iron transporter permease [Actinomycetes bacterium]
MISDPAGAIRRAALLALPVGFLGVFFAYPVASIVGLGLAHGVPDLGQFRGILWFTVWQAAVSTALTLALALPGAYVFARLDFPGKSLLRAIVTVPFVLPTVVVGAAFLALVGPDGLLGIRLDRSVPAILVAHVFFNYAVVVRVVGGLWSHLDPRQEEAAQLLGASRVRAWIAVTLPALAPAIGAAALLVFLFTFTSFGIVQILGGPRFATVEVEIYRQTAQLLDLRAAAALSMLQFAVVSVLLLGQAWLGRRRESMLSLVAASSAVRRPRGKGWFVLAANLVVMLVLLVTPLAVLVVRSFADGLGAYRALGQNDVRSTLFVPARDAIGWSLAYGSAATVIALVVGGLAAAAMTRRAGRLTRAIDGLLMLPLGVSAVTVGFGFLVTLDTPPLDLRSSPLLVPLAQALVAVPFVVRTVLPVLRAVDARLREAAAVLGASPWRVWREVDLPIAWRALLVAAGFAFAISLGEFGATVFIARPDTPTVPVAIFRLLGRPGELNYGQAMALSTILMVLCAGSLLALERVRLGRSAEF